MASAHCISWHYAGKGIPTWDPFLGLTKEQYEAEDDSAVGGGDRLLGIAEEDEKTHERRFDAMLSGKIADGRRIQPTGLLSDPRLPPRAVPATCIVALLQDAAARYESEIAADHAAAMADWRARKNGTWAQRIAAAKEPAPTLEEARELRARRLGPPERKKTVWHYAPDCGSYYDYAPPVEGTWHEWELLEIWDEQTRFRRIDEAEARTDAFMKSLYPTWGGGT